VDFFGIRNAADPAGNTEWNIDNGGDPVDPGTVNTSSVRAGGDVIEHELIRTLDAIPLRQVDNVADDSMITKLYAFDDDAIAHVEARNYAFRWNDTTSAVVISPSSKARPLIAAGMPRLRSPSRS